ncbi:MAG: CYTH domain-containing protein, partial [Oscillospiraceae bacterium]
PLIAPLICGGTSIIAMESVYYDTGNRSRSLRRRSENGDFIFTLKSGNTGHGALSSRGEWEVSDDSLESALAHLCRLGAPTLGISPDAPSIAAFSFTRTCARLDVSDSLSLTLCCDIGDTIHELELELICGEIAELTAFGECVCRTFDARPESRSKLARALLNK